MLRLKQTQQADDISVDYSQRVLDRIAETVDDSFHNFPSSLNQYVVENGDIGVLDENYVQYELLGSVNGTPGVYQVSGNWLDNVFNITHSFFSPF